MPSCLFKYSLTNVIRMLWEFGNSFELDRVIGSLAISAKFREKNDKKGETLKIAENQKCLSVIQI